MVVRLVQFIRSLKFVPNIYKAGTAFRKLPGAAISRTWPSFAQNFALDRTLVSRIYRTVIAGCTQKRPNSLLRAFSGLSGAVILRDYPADQTNNPLFGINNASKMSRRESTNAFSFTGFISSLGKYHNTLPQLNLSSITPKEFIGSGCNAAVWSADCDSALVDSSEVAVKVLYNYYESERLSPAETLNNDASTLNRDWHLMRKQLNREFHGRPSSSHPNIVPILGHFVDKPPNRFDSSSSCVSSPVPGSQGTGWAEAEKYPEGFGENVSKTCYLLMPKYDATLADLLSGGLKQPESPDSQPIELGDSISLSSASRDSPTHSRSSDRSFEFLSASGTSSASLVSRSDLLGQAAEIPINRSHGDHIEQQPEEGTVKPLPAPFLAQLDVEPQLLSVTPSCSFSPPTPAPPELSTDERIDILAQLFEAVAELEARQIAHRDIKLNNILIRSRPVESQFRNSAEMERLGSRYHVALTDFGCAIPSVSSRSRPSSASVGQASGGGLARLVLSAFERRGDAAAELAAWGPVEFLSHSGNLALLAPEVSSALARDERIRPESYARSDLWAAATLSYPLFGASNPFASGADEAQQLESATFLEEQLPAHPQTCPGPVALLMRACLSREPGNRPPAQLVADVLHTLALLRHYRRWHSDKTDPRSNLLDIDLVVLDGDEEAMRQSLESGHLDYAQLIRSSSGRMRARLADQLVQFLNSCWTADWLAGASRPPHGVRCMFYRRLTLDRLNLCLKLIRKFEAHHSAKMARNIFR